MTAPMRVAAVVVSYNRRDLLLESLRAIRAQTHTVETLIVVDNASSDGSADAVEAGDFDADLVRLPVNVGGAGGFAAGLAVALDTARPDAVWLMDDDTVPTSDALSELVAGMTAAGAVVAASRVVWTDGSDHPMNTPRRRIGRAAQAALMPVRSASFVSMLVSADRVRERGLPVADFFIWNDDFEFSTRMIRGAEGVYVPASVVEHRTKRLVATDDDPGERFYYEVRNKVWTYRLSRSLTVVEKTIYGASTVRRWVRTFRRSTDRSTLRAALLNGMRDGVLTRPRPNSVVLADAEVVARAVHSLEQVTRR